MLTTDRLIICQLTLEDAPFILELLNTPGWLQFIGDRGIRSLDDANAYIQNNALKNYEELGYGPYLIFHKADNQPIGMSGLFKRETLEYPDVGFALMPDYMANGYGYEAASAVIEYANKTLRLPRVYGITNPNNHLSIRLLKKLGMSLEGSFAFGPEKQETLLFRYDM
ncbi:GNAT family N-acetyltransferase [Spirosoma sp. BT702]|uniref:GNAT family N-acetyltransferase n=1 Tax=Spirosoma profusum TaxID=2771354 RepID=A0A926XWY3_9BACT|nr:GNAT family N-acetyltransferase [Spirosoma profusum]MBD2699377.1 GNAT family N-acetyltransferase [Spirosoma profusum]